MRNHMPSEARLENFWIWTLKKQHIKEIICRVKWSKKNYGKIKKGPKMLNFGASKPRVKGGPGPRGPPWIRTCIILSFEELTPVAFRISRELKLVAHSKQHGITKVKEYVKCVNCCLKCQHWAGHPHVANDHHTEPWKIHFCGSSAQLLPPATKLGQGYVFTGVCHSVNRGESTWPGTPRTRYTPPGPGTPPGTRYTPQDQVHTPMGPGTPPGTRYTPRTRYTPLGPGTPRDQVYPPRLGIPPGPGTPPSPGTRYTPPGPGTPPGTRYTPWDQVHSPGTRYTPQDQVHQKKIFLKNVSKIIFQFNQLLYHPPPPDQGDTVYARAVRILLECILVLFKSNQLQTNPPPPIFD